MSEQYINSIMHGITIKIENDVFGNICVFHWSTPLYSC
jgi:hypothetical protein